MSSRALTTEHADYAVRVVNCGGTIVHQRVRIATEVSPLPDSTRDHRNRNEYFDAFIIASDDNSEMSAIGNPPDQIEIGHADYALSVCSDHTSSFPSSTSTSVTSRGLHPTAPTLPQASPCTPVEPKLTSSELDSVMSAIAEIGTTITSIQINLDALNQKVGMSHSLLTNVKLSTQRLERKFDQLLSMPYGPI
ncbi:Hypothetical predicted protein [Mytilus galloprovincialis]|uniref:Uncharacterized protein n=1 Tax=Mytilus galloprovincialis TaxID=29158 RepID=A0A8B6EE25_MYTGA|nr:Hypothetical predicted protein [Mytilus galloprovincialis]